MPHDDTQPLLRRFTGGDPGAGAEILRRVGTGDDSSPALLVAAALGTGTGTADRDRLLARAAAVAVTTRDRQLVAIAAARLGDDDDLVRALVDDHLADHPDSLLAGWIATRTRPVHQEHPCDN
jgi:hypothetical protein